MTLGFKDNIMTWKEEDIIVAIVLFLLSFLIGWLQSSKVEFKDEGKKDKYERPIILMKKNWTYIIGWIILFLVIIGAHFYANSHLELEEIVTEFWKERWLLPRSNLKLGISEFDSEGLRISKEIGLESDPTIFS